MVTMLQTTFQMLSVYCKTSYCYVISFQFVPGGYIVWCNVISSLNQRWSSSVTQYGVTRPQWVHNIINTIHHDDKAKVETRGTSQPDPGINCRMKTKWIIVIIILIIIILILNLSSSSMKIHPYFRYMLPKTLHLTDTYGLLALSFSTLTEKRLSWWVFFYIVKANFATFQ